MNELDFQSALHVLVHPNMGLAVRIVKHPGAELIDKVEDDYLLTAKLFCGYCSTYLCDES